MHVEAGQGGSATVRVLGEGNDAIAAAQEAADHLALALGQAPGPLPRESVAELALLQQVDAAILARDLDRVETLIAAAPEEARSHPRLRMAEARIAFHRMDLPQARAHYEAALSHPLTGQDRRLRALARTSLASVHALRGEPERARELLSDLPGSLDQAGDADVLGIVHMNLGLLEQESGGAAAADLHLSRARHLLAGVGDLQRQSVLASNLGVHALRRERLLEAARELERALAGFEVLGDRSSTLHVLSAMLELQLARLDLPAADAVAQRMRTLEDASPLAGSYARTVEVMRLLEHGRLRDASALLAGLRDLLAGRNGPPPYEAAVTLLETRLLAAQAAPPGMRVGQAERARDGLAPHHNLSILRAEAWRLLVQAALDDGPVERARREADGLLAWAQETGLRGARLHALVAGAAVARFTDGPMAARASLEAAWQLLEEGGSPWHWLLFAEAGLPWLAQFPDQEGRLLRLSQELAPAAVHHFGAAVARVRLLDALGPPDAREAALSQARRLAGERPLPADLAPSPPLRSEQDLIEP